MHIVKNVHMAGFVLDSSNLSARNDVAVSDKRRIDNNDG